VRNHSGWSLMGFIENVDEREDLKAVLRVVDSLDVSNSDEKMIEKIKETIAQRLSALD